MGSPRATTLRHKLDALSFNEPFDNVSLPLIERLLEHIVQSSEGFRHLSLRTTSTSQQLEEYETKVEALKRDSARLTAENNQLHLQLMSQAEQHAASQRENYHQTKRLEDQLAELSFIKQKTIERYLALEQENEGLKEKLGLILKSETTGAIEHLTPGMAISGPFDLPPHAATASTSTSNRTVDVQKATQSRLAALEASVKEKQALIQESQLQVRALQESIGLRDAEIQRLSRQLEAGPEVDRLHLAYRAEANEHIILQLNDQMQQLQSDVEAAKKQAVQAGLLAHEERCQRQAADAKLSKLAKEREATSKEIAELKVALLQAKADRARKPSMRYENSENITPNIMGKALGASKKGSAGEARDKALAAEISRKSEALEHLQAEKESAMFRIDELSVQLTDLQSTTAKQTKALGAAQEFSETLQAKINELERSIAAYEAEREGTTFQLKDLSEAKTRSEGKSADLSEALTATTKQRDELKAGLELEKSRRTEYASLKDAAQLEVNRLRAQVAVLEGQNTALQEEHAKALDRLKEVRETWAVQTRELGHLQHLPPRLDDLQRQVAEYMSKLTGAEADASKHRAEALRAKDAALLAQQDVDSLRRMLDEAEADRSRLRLAMQEAQSLAMQQTSVVKSLRADQSASEATLDEAKAQAAQLREQLDEAQSVAREAQFALRAAQEVCAGLQQQLSSKGEEAVRAQKQAAVAQQAAEGAQLREAELRAEVRDLAERARRAEVSAAERDAYAQSLRNEQEAERARARATAEELAGLRHELLQRQKEVEQMTTLSLKGDATITEYVAALKRMSSTLRGSEVQIRDLEGQLQQQSMVLEQKASEISELKETVRALDADRDVLQSTLDSKAEEMAQLSDELGAAHSQIDAANRELDAAHQQMGRVEEAMRESQSSAEQLTERLTGEQARVQALEADNLTVREELAAVSDDLQALVRENQIIVSQLTGKATEAESWRGELRIATERAETAEHLVRAREADVEDIRQAYESLAVEQQQVQSMVKTLEREITVRDAQLTAQLRETQLLEEAHASAQAQILQQVADLQAFEKQVDMLSRQINRGNMDAEGLDRERHKLLERLHGAEHMRYEVERQKEGLQRALAATEGQLNVAQARLHDLTSDNEALHQKISIDSHRMAELEDLIASLRTAQFQANLLHESGAAGPLALQGNEAGSLSPSSKPNSSMEGPPLLAQVQRLQRALAHSETEASRLRSRVRDLEATVTSLQSQLAASQLQAAGAEQSAQTLASKPAIEANEARQEGQDALIASLKAELSTVKEENDRLLDLLGKLDSERSQMEMRLMALEPNLLATGWPQSQPQTSNQPHAGPSGPPLAPLGGSRAAPHDRAAEASLALQREIERLKREVDVERLARQKAEKDFEVLVDRLDVLPGLQLGPKPVQAPGESKAGTYISAHHAPSAA